MKQEWIELLVSQGIDNNFKILINKFFIPDNILLNDFVANSNALKGSEDSYLTQQYVTKSLNQIQRSYPPFYPEWGLIDKIQAGNLCIPYKY